ncbi:hypothetical protein [Corynebacterium efficiens YS-314]|uniref:Uncharacterized protein n=1 Tax=Corynebacterium efficiens (strain DSM 44549 / YS-314 / AJ 12310 / JCM 11189 / NBRC 100395) TaxID=196164 RepID=Q8FQG8_COREF|nr:hypothetical protein [Corynebacterium efficiens YS-314]
MLIQVGLRDLPVQGRGLLAAQTSGMTDLQEINDPHAAFRLTVDTHPGAHPRHQHHRDQQQAHVSQHRVHIADEFAETDETEHEAHQHRHHVDRPEPPGTGGRQASPQGVEHTQGGVEDHSVDHHRHHLPQDRVEFIDDAQHRHVIATDGLHGQEQGDGADNEQDTVDQATDHPAATSHAGIEHVPADDHRHGHRDHEVEGGVVHPGHKPVRQRGGHLPRGTVELVDAGEVTGDDRVHGCDGDEHEDERGDRPDHGGHLVHIQHAGGQHEHHHDEGTHPEWQTPLLIEVRPGTGEHHHTGGEQGQHHTGIEKAGEHRMTDPAEHLPVLTGAEITAQLQDDQRHHGHHHRGDHRTPEPVDPEGDKVLHHLLPGGEPRPDDDAHERQGHLYDLSDHLPTTSRLSPTADSDRFPTA